jgi:hypothetical protein
MLPCLMYPSLFFLVLLIVLFTGWSETSFFLPEVRFLGLGLTSNLSIELENLPSEAPGFRSCQFSLFLPRDRTDALTNWLIHTRTLFWGLQERAFMQWCMSSAFGQNGHDHCFPVIFKPDLLSKVTTPSTRYRVLCPQKSLICLSVHDSGRR